MINKEIFFPVLILLIVVASRLPFIDAGYGPEEDAWGLKLTADNIARTGVYEVSRLPGHPFQEIIYSKISQHGFYLMNWITVLISAAGVVFFYLLLLKLNVHNAFFASVTFAFVPVIYINSMNVMDYMWALSLIIASFYFLISGKLPVAGILLGCAVGCRITSGAMALPFIVYLYDKNVQGYVKKTALFIFPFIITSVVCFYPVFTQYDAGFFTYYQHFPIPSALKNIYKGTIAVWGVTGLIALMFFFFNILKKIFTRGKNNIASNNRIVAVCLIILVVYGIAFIKLPLKAAFMMPLIPFALIVVALYINRSASIILMLCMIFSSLFAGINLNDSRRGNEPTKFSWSRSVSGQQISFDLLKGPVIADYEKQKHMVAYAKDVINKSNDIQRPSVVIAGWYLNFIKVLDKHPISNIQYVYYIDEKELQNDIAKKYAVYYLADQNRYNDLRFDFSATSALAKPFP
jgi:hypothetical protein